MRNYLKVAALTAAAGTMTVAAPVSAADHVAVPAMVSIVDLMPAQFGAGFAEETARFDDDDDRRYRRGNRRGNRYSRGRRDDRYRGERVRQDTRVWQGRDGRYYCRKENGTTGLLIGGVVGGLAGREIARDRTLGAIVGAAAGALAGREIDRSDSRCR